MTGLKTTSLLKRFRTASAGVCAALAVSVASFSASVTAQAPAVGWPEKEEVITRNTDFCARYGGEEFVAILPNTDEKGAKVKAEEIRDAIESLGIEHSKSTVSSVITASLGVATVNFVNHHNWTLTSILNTADKALYDAKTGGRNRCVFSSLP